MVLGVNSTRYKVHTPLPWLLCNLSSQPVLHMLHRVTSLSLHTILKPLTLPYVWKLIGPPEFLQVLRQWHKYINSTGIRDQWAVSSKSYHYTLNGLFIWLCISAVIIFLLVVHVIFIEVLVLLSTQSKSNSDRRASTLHQIYFDITAQS